MHMYLIYTCKYFEHKPHHLVVYIHLEKDPDVYLNFDVMLLTVFEP